MFEITTAGTGGDLVATDVVQTPGVDTIIDGTLTVAATIIDGNPFTTILTTASDASSQALQISNSLNAASGTGVIASSDGGILTLTYTSVGDKVDTIITLSAGTSQTATNPLVVIVDGSGSGALWIDNLASSTFPGTAYWGAKRYTTGTSVGGYEIYPVQAVNGSIGVDGLRGPGRFSLSVNLPDNTTYTVGSFQFNMNALEALASVFGAGITPVAGDTAPITYTRLDTTVYTLNAVHDGTGVDVDDWNSFVLEIDGNLLVSKSVVASKVNLFPADVGAGSGANTGERMNIDPQTIKIYDAAGNLRVVFGDLTGL